MPKVEKAANDEAMRPHMFRVHAPLTRLACPAGWDEIVDMMVSLKIVPRVVKAASDEVYGSRSTQRAWHARQARDEIVDMMASLKIMPKVLKAANDEG